MAFGAAGLAATCAQVLLLRELLVSAAGDEASIGVGLAAWLLGIATGASLARRLPSGIVCRLAMPTLAFLALAPGAAIVAGRLLRTLWAPPPGELPGLGLIFALAFTALAPAGFLVGAAFTSLAASSSRLLEPNSALLRLYVCESAGSLAGGVLATLLVGTLLAPLPAALAAGLAATLLALPASRDDRLGGRKHLASIVLLLVSSLLVAGRLDRLTEQVRFSGTAPGEPLLAATDTPFGHIAVSGSEVRHLYESGQYSGSLPDPYADEALAHLAGSLSERPSRILSLAGIERGTLRFLLRHPVERLDLLCPDVRELAFVRGYLAPEDQRALDDARVTILSDDPRRFLSRTSATYDLILLLAPDPVTVSRARLTTAEFFRACAARLSPRGTLVLSLRTAPAVLTGETAALAGSVYGALRAAFPVVRATPGPDTLLLAGFDAGAVTLDTDTAGTVTAALDISAAAGAAASSGTASPTTGSRTSTSRRWRCSSAPASSSRTTASSARSSR